MSSFQQFGSRAAWRRSGILFAVFFMLLSIAGNARAQVIDRVVAVVNDDVILLSDLETTGKAFFEQVKEKAPPASREEALKKARADVLESLIEKSLIDQKAKKDKITVTDDDVKRAYESVIARNGLTEGQFLEKLKQVGMTKDLYLKNLRQQILQEKLINTDVRSKIAITDDMVKEYYEAHKNTPAATKGGYALLQIGFAWGQSPEANKSEAHLYADKQEARKRAEQVLQMARQGQDFGELAKKYSNLPSAADGGDIGVFQADDMEPDMREAVTHLKPGEISNIIETPAGFQFFKLTANKDGIDPHSTYESAKEGIRDLLYQQQLKKEFDKWVNNLKEQAYIKLM